MCALFDRIDVIYSGVIHSNWHANIVFVITIDFLRRPSHHHTFVHFKLDFASIPKDHNSHNEIQLRCDNYYMICVDSKHRERPAREGGETPELRNDM